VNEVLRLTRRFDAPRETVFEAWTSPEHLTSWWGPGEFKTTVAEVDLRAGGSYKLVIEARGAPRMELHGVFHEVDPPSRLVYTWKWVSGWPDPSDMLVTVEFIAHGAETELILTQTGFAGDGGSGPYDAGWNSGLDKLAAYLSKLRAGF
jgi:uncharacterized protein YndB with AHSA1/START domain